MRWLNAADGDLDLYHHGDVIEGHLHLVPRCVENCGDRLVLWSKLEGDRDLPDFAEKTLAATNSSFMTAVCALRGRTSQLVNNRCDSHNERGK